MAKLFPASAEMSETQTLLQDRPAFEESTRDNEQRFQQVQTRAYKLWEDAGRPDGDAPREHFWHEAEIQIDGETSRAF